MLIYTVVSAVALVVALLASVIEQRVGWRATFVLPAIAGIAGSYLAWRYVPESRAHERMLRRALTATAWSLTFLPLTFGIAAARLAGTWNNVVSLHGAGRERGRSAGTPRIMARPVASRDDRASHPSATTLAVRDAACRGDAQPRAGRLRPPTVRLLHRGSRSRSRRRRSGIAADAGGGDVGGEAGGRTRSPKGRSRLDRRWSGLDGRGAALDGARPTRVALLATGAAPGAVRVRLPRRPDRVDQRVHDRHARRRRRRQRRDHQSHRNWPAARWAAPCWPSSS